MGDNKNTFKPSSQQNDSFKNGAEFLGILEDFESIQDSEAMPKGSQTADKSKKKGKRKSRKGKSVKSWNHLTKRRFVLNDGEVFSPILWRKFHIDEHLFDFVTPEEQNKLSPKQIEENIAKIKTKFPHLSKYYNEDSVYNETYEERIERLFDKPANIDEYVHIPSRHNYLWQRHVNMLKDSKSTSYFNFLSEYDRQSCKACSQGKTCSSKHCKSCGCGNKCQKHLIDIDFLMYKPQKPLVKNGKLLKDSPLIDDIDDLEQIASNNRSSLTMRGFTIMRKTPEMGRNTLLSAHIDGTPCGLKSGHKKCLACAMAEENVIMHRNKQRMSAPARLRQTNPRKKDAKT